MGGTARFRTRVGLIKGALASSSAQVWKMRLAASEADLDLTLGSPLMALRDIQALGEVRWCE